MARPARAGSMPAAEPAKETRCTGMVEVRVREPQEASAVLADAVRMVEEAANRYGTGIMVTEVGEGSYVVRAHPAVPHGLVRQQGCGAAP
ncbi:hypothetical protein [Arthrobacter nitrophenolicus]|uniref:Uncharacterized protein n=1 Tax=Arthrobacter nitrophenolicus TaxID=683150 RepID=A0A4R5XQP3_9MICC|nr:hypothetical protein [Arthrobacter nitrophenolicus]TDL33252.1 hypothetical protein E2R57_18805 [Arthrobacter nitrophenolicus]